MPGGDFLKRHKNARLYPLSALATMHLISAYLLKDVANKAAGVCWPSMMCTVACQPRSNRCFCMPAFAPAEVGVTVATTVPSLEEAVPVHKPSDSKFVYCVIRDIGSVPASHVDVSSAAPAAPTAEVAPGDVTENIDAIAASPVDSIDYNTIGMFAAAHALVHVLHAPHCCSCPCCEAHPLECLCLVLICFPVCRVCRLASVRVRCAARIPWRWLVHWHFNGSEGSSHRQQPCPDRASCPTTAPLSGLGVSSQGSFRV
jgi:hypothetical protein